MDPYKEDEEELEHPLLGFGCLNEILFYILLLAASVLIVAVIDTIGGLL